MADNLEISGSDARRIMAGEGLAVWEEKTGRRARKDLSFFLPAMIGLATEGANRAYYKHKTGRTVYDPRPTGASSVNLAYNAIGEDKLGVKLQSRAFKWLTGHLDGIVNDAATGGADDWGVFESKHTGALSEWNPPEAVVERNFWQGAHYCLLTGFQWIDFSCFYGLSDWQTFRVRPSEDELTTLLGTLNRFQKCLLDDTPPEGGAKVEAPRIDPKRAYTEADLRTWPCANAWAAEAGVAVETWEAAEQHEAALVALKSLELPEDAKTVEGFGIVMGIAKNGAKRIRRLEEKTPPARAQRTTRRASDG